MVLEWLPGGTWFLGEGKEIYVSWLWVPLPPSKEKSNPLYLGLFWNITFLVLVEVLKRIFL